MTILDQYGKPIKANTLDQPQTAAIMSLKTAWHSVNRAANLTPERIDRLLRAADTGDLSGQAELFEDMLERDAHLYAEMDKRKSAPGCLEWSIAPPRNASATEKKLAAYADEVLRDLPDFDDVIKGLMDGVGHGFAPIELSWDYAGGEWLPVFYPRPQHWFQLTSARDKITLRDGSLDGAALQPFGWLMHVHGLAKTGYAGRLPLYRVLVWPFIYKLYGLSDFAEFLEVFGLPFIKGKYPPGATLDQQRSLLRAVTSLAHDARAIMPADMEMEIIQAASGGGQGTGHLSMVDWGDKAQSKAILGGTLTSQADGKTSTNALGSVHQDVRLDIRNADCRQAAGTLTRDLVYPLLALNKPGVTSLRRCPRFVFDTSEPEDLALFAEALPKLVGIGLPVPTRWAHDKLKVPVPEQNEPVLTTASSAPALKPTTTQTLAASRQGQGLPFTPEQRAVEALLPAALASPIDPERLRTAIAAAKSPEDLEHRLAALMAGAEVAEFEDLLARALFAADVLGYVHAEE